jgi:hypothetical protein
VLDLFIRTNGKINGYIIQISEKAINTIISFLQSEKIDDILEIDDMFQAITFLNESSMMKLLVFLNGD